MAMQKVTADVVEDYFVQAQVKEFTYELDYTEKNPQAISHGGTPTDMLLVSLASCHLMTMVSYLNMKKLEFTILKCNIEGEFSYVNDAWFLQANLSLETDAKLVGQLDQVENFIHRYCKISSILSQNNDIKLTFKLV